MTATEHLIAWIESSREHYDRLLKLERDLKMVDAAQCNASNAAEAVSIVASAYREATRGGDMFMGEHSPRTLLDAASALLDWELEA